MNSTHEPHNVHFQEIDESKAVEPTELNVGMLKIVIFYVWLPHKYGIIFKLK